MILQLYWASWIAILEILAWEPVLRSPEHHVDIRILHSGSKGPIQGGIPETLVCRIPHVYVVFWVPIILCPSPPPQRAAAARARSGPTGAPTEA